MKKYYIHNGTYQQGPYDVEDLKSKHLTRETPVWYEGLDDWTIAGKVNELSEVLGRISPPPFKPKTTTSDSLVKKGPDLFGLIIGIAVILMTLVVTMVIISKMPAKKDTPAEPTPQSYQQKVLTVEETERSQPEKFLKAEGEFSENLFGGKLKVKGVIKNKATVVSYKDAVVRVTLYDKNNFTLGSKEYTIRDSFPPYSEVKFELKVENDQPVTDLKYAVVKANIVSR